MKQILLTLILLLFSSGITLSAQGKFDKEKIHAEMCNYIKEETKLSHEEATAFFALYDAMKEKQRSLFNQKKALAKQQPTTDAACRTAIVKQDQLQREIQSIEANYHKEMMKVVSPAKVYKALEAERRFMRSTFKRAAKR